MTGTSGTSSLRVGERLIAWSDDGLLAAEYALFDASEIVLHASDFVTVREAGYMTTARQALERLAQSAVTPELAAAAAKTLPAEVTRSFARGFTVRSVAAQLGAQELFDGAIYRASPEVQRYEGTWLDLRALTPQVELPHAAMLLQALHLAVTLAEVSGDTPLLLSTAGTMRARRPGERTYVRVSLDGAQRLPEALSRLRPRTIPVEVDATRETRLHPAFLARVRERMSKDTPPPLQAHLTLLDGLLSELTKPAGPMADEELRAIERQLDERDLREAGERIERLERVRGNIPAIRYLQARLALLRGEEPTRNVAQRLSDIADEDEEFHQATLGAARTWMAAGEEARARHFATLLADNPSATESARLLAQEILATLAPETRPSLPAPEVTAELVNDIPPTVRMPQRPPHRLGLGDVPPPHKPPAPTVRPPVPHGLSRERAGGRAPAQYDPELLESLPLPTGSNESDLGVDDRPSTPAHARVAMTRLARDLARDYRLWYGKALRCDVIAIDGMQQHLTQRYFGADITDDAVAWELRRHGALLSEVLARKLGGAWIDVGPSEPGYWAMLLGDDTRTHPIGRVYRFVSQGHRERDLVSYFIELEGRVRSSQPRT